MLQAIAQQQQRAINAALQAQIVALQAQKAALEAQLQQGARPVLVVSVSGVIQPGAIVANQTANRRRTGINYRPTSVPFPYRRARQCQRTCAHKCQRSHQLFGQSDSKW